MKVSYGVIWRESGGEQAEGRLAIGPHSIQLRATGDESLVERELPFDRIASAELRVQGTTESTETPKGRLALTSTDGREIQIESAADRWIVGDLVESLFVHSLTDGQVDRRILVALKLRPGSRERAHELLRAGPPFDPSRSALALLDVFLLEDEALFLFQTDGADDLVELVKPNFWQAAAGWRELMSGGVSLAEHVYSWARQPRASRELHPGLGL